jgi:hypothetical protein
MIPQTVLLSFFCFLTLLPAFAIAQNNSPAVDGAVKTLVDSSNPSGELTRHTVSIKISTESFSGLSAAINSFFDFNVYLDGEFLTGVSPGYTKTVEKIMLAGEHSIGVRHGPAGPGQGAPDGTRGLGLLEKFFVNSSKKFDVKVNVTARQGYGLAVSSAEEKFAIVSHKLQENTVEKIVRRSATFSVPKGVTKEIEDSIQTSETITIENASSLEKEIGVTLKLLQASIKTACESSISSSKTKQETFTRRVSITGDGKAKYKTVWVKVYRQGIATIKVNGKETRDVKFEYPIDFDLSVEEVSE